MKIALCYHGIAKGTNFKEGGLPVGYAKEFELISQNLIDKNTEHDFDIFLHSWSREYEGEIVEKMKPKAFLFEESRVFKKVSPYLRVKETIKKWLGKGYEYKRLNNIYSRWYSFYKVCELVTQYDKEGYDLVIVTRFDMCLLHPLVLDGLDLEKVYSGDWRFFYNEKGNEVEEPYYKDLAPENIDVVQKGYPFDDEGLQDFFFIAPSEYMLNEFGRIFFELKKLVRKYGMSNHLIAYGKLKEDGMLDQHERVLKYFDDYFLSRWLW